MSVIGQLKGVYQNVTNIHTYRQTEDISKTEKRINFAGKVLCSIVFR